MSPDVFAAELRALTAARPYREFAVELSSGARLVVYHPEVIRFDGRVVRFTDSDASEHVFEPSDAIRLFTAIGPPPDDESPGLPPDGLNGLAE